MGLLSYFSAAEHITEAASKTSNPFICSTRYRYFYYVLRSPLMPRLIVHRVTGARGTLSFINYNVL